MINAKYLRIQASICLQLSSSTLDQRVAAKLVEMAEDFSAKADELDAARSSPLRQQERSDNGID